MRKYLLHSSITLFISLFLAVGLCSARDLSRIDPSFNQPLSQGVGRLTFWGFHIYDVTLYRSSNLSSAEFALDIKYQKSSSGSLIAHKTAEEMKKMGVSDSQATIWEKELAEVLPNVESGQTLTGVYSPKVGATLFYEGKKIAQIPGVEFSKAFFGIWLDPKTSAPKLRAELLGNACPPPLFSGAC
ncbi:chalcone isomerase family protein [Polynucleobacter sp. CS-Odin-A6]|uniref:chalcone isomerase family protein n=1 Tax=Polynucleobacter sp. CS-Odin-A6 TaxID=2689106 RepID=UPI001C0B5D49|nr:chalcone isomerase family protein [Polynucleobacter sp. CS-Odin-A6]MBU3620476.1 chalcone isomerase family protein [Polynucleobacter sp. CS-Odin-A6]